MFGTPTPRQLEVSDEFLDLLSVQPSAITDEIFEAAHSTPAQRAYIDENYDLPLDPQSRMERADQYWPQEYFHGTTAAPYNIPRTDMDGGFHMGSAEAAWDRNRANSSSGEYELPPIYATGGVDGRPPLSDILQSLTDAEGSGAGQYPLFYNQGQFYTPEELGDPGLRQTMLEGGIPEVEGYSGVWNRADALEGMGLNPTAEARGFREGTRTTPYRANLGDVLESNDADAWTTNRLRSALLERNAEFGDVPEGVTDSLARLYEDQSLVRLLPPEVREASGYPTETSDLNRRFNNEMQQALRSQGYDSIAYRNIFEGYHQDPSVIAFEPQQVRERFSARFDPRLRHLGQATAGFGGLAYGISGQEAAAQTLRPFEPGEFRQNGDGSISTELSVTIQTPDGAWVNVPSLLMGPDGPVEYDPDDEEVMQQVAEYLRATGVQLPTFRSVDEAVAAAQARSDARGTATP